jgi:hypothetical protein
MSVPGLVESTKNANMSTRAALVTSLPVRASPWATESVVRPRRVRKFGQALCREVVGAQPSGLSPSAARERSVARGGSPRVEAR